MNEINWKSTSLEYFKGVEDVMRWLTLRLSVDIVIIKSKLTKAKKNITNLGDNPNE